MIRGVSVQNFLGGVSQQPVQKRFPSQAEESINAWPSLVDGLKKRPPTKHLVDFFPTSEDYKIHAINRSPSERYIAFFRKDEIRVWDLVNEEWATVTNSAGAPLTSSDLAYLPSSGLDDNLELVSVADYTWVVNKTVTPAMQSNVTPTSEKSALVTIVQGNYSSKYDIIIDGARYQLTGAAYTAGRTPNGSGTGGVDRDAIAADAIAADLAETITGSSGSSGSGMTLSFDGTADCVLSAPRAVSGSFKLELRVEWGTGAISTVRTPFLPYNCTQTQVLNGFDQEFFYYATGESMADYLSLSGDVQLGLGSAPRVDAMDIDLDVAALEAFARGASYYSRNWSVRKVTWRIVEDRTTVVSGSTIQVDQFGSTLYIRKANGDDFTIEVDDSNAGSDMQLVKGSVPSFSDLPTTAPNDFRVRVEGNPEENADDYYLRFETTGSSGFGDGRWVESAGPELEYLVDGDTMPHVLVNTVDEDGSITGTVGKPFFRFEKFEYAPREAGDNVTNRLPSFIGNPIKAAALYRGRLCLVSGESVSASEVNEYGNFFRTTVTELIDGDRVDVTAATDKVSLFTSAVQHGERLVLFSNQTQFLFDSAGELLTPRTASLTLASAYESETSVRPVVLGRFMFFPFERDGFIGAYQYVDQSQGDRAAYFADEITSVVTRYMSGTVTSFQGSDLGGVLLVGTDDFAGGLYAYKFVDSGGERIVSSWMKLDLSVGIFTEEIKGVQFINDVAYIAVRRAGTNCLESIEFTDGDADPGLDYVCALDRRLDETQVTAVYDAGNDCTEITLPYATTAPTQVFDRAGVKGRIYTAIGGTTGKTTLKVEGDITGDSFYVGQTYEMRHTLSPAFVPGRSLEGGTSALLGGRTKVREWRIRYSQSGYFRVLVQPKYRASSYVEWSGINVQSGAAVLGDAQVADGEINVPVWLGNEDFDAVLYNDSALPSNFTSGEAMLKYASRRSRLG